ERGARWGRAPTLPPNYTADSAVGPLHPDALHGQKQAVRVDCGAVPFARRDEDRFTRPGRERTRVELDYQLALEHDEELVARLTMPAAVELSRPRMEDGYAVHRPELGIR